MDWFEILERALGLLKCVERQRGIVLGLLYLVVEPGVFFLKVAGVRKDDATQIDSGWRGVDRAAEAFFDEARNPSAVVEVSVGEDDGVDFFRGNRSVTPVALAPLFRALE